jgi:CII-binding regulator of phage lambda lysogenization HflD
MHTFNINKEIQQIQNNIGIIISCFFIKQNQTLVPKIDPDYVNNQISNLSDKMSRINNCGVSAPQSSFSPNHIELLNKSISQIHLHDLSETTTSKYINDKRIIEIEAMIQKQKGQIRELGGLLQRYANTPIQPIQTNPNSYQPIIKNIIIPDNEVSKLNAQIKAIDSKMSLFKNDINKYVLDKRNAVNKSLKLFSGEYNKLLNMINSLNNTLSNRINSLNSRVTDLNNKTNSRIDVIHVSLKKKIDQTNTTLNTRIDTVNSSLTATIGEKEAALNTRIDTVNSSLTATIGEKEAALNTRIDTVNSSLTATIGEKEAALNTGLEQLSNHINTNFGVLYEDSNQTSGRTVYFNKVKVNEIEFASVSNISDITSLSAAIGNLTTNFNSIYQNTNVTSDKTAYFNKVVSENIECSNFTGVSDERLKKNIVDLKNVGKDLDKLRTVGFDWKSNNEADIGFIAQDVEKIFPTLVKTNKDGFKSVKYINFVPILVQGYREQAEELRKLKKILMIGLVVFFFFFMYKCI